MRISVVSFCLCLCLLFASPLMAQCHLRKEEHYVTMAVQQNKKITFTSRYTCGNESKRIKIILLKRKASQKSKVVRTVKITSGRAEAFSFTPDFSGDLYVTFRYSRSMGFYFASADSVVWIANAGPVKLSGALPLDRTSIVGSKGGTGTVTTTVDEIGLPASNP